MPDKLPSPIQTLPDGGSRVTLSRAVVLVSDFDGQDVPNVHGPPALLPVGNRPLLLHALDAISDAGLREAAVVTGTGSAATVDAVLADADPSLAVEVRDCPIDGDLGAALSTVRDFLGTEPFLLHLGDSLQKHGLDPLLDGDELRFSDARVLTRETHRQEQSRLAVASSTSHVESLRGLRRTGAPLEHAGVYALGGQALELATGGGAWLEAADLVEALDGVGGHVELRDGLGAWRMDRGREAWLEGNRLALEGIERDVASSCVFDSDIQGNVAVHPSAEIHSSVVRGPAAIGPLARLTDAYVGPYSSIAAGVLIDTAEVENSIILQGASIRVLGGRLEASIIGPRARVFRDLRLPKAFRLSVGEGAEVALA